MFLLPPGSAKSTYSSQNFPPWVYTAFPGSSIIACSHTEDLADKFSKDVRRIIGDNEKALGYGMDKDSRKADRWNTSNGGAYKMAGVGGNITGSRSDIGLIDDPVKSFKDAESQKYRDTQWDWYRNDFLTRLKPGGRIVLIMTRWHQDDLAGRLIKTDPDSWRVIRLPAICDSEDDPLGREIGEALWPEWETAEMLARKRREVGERTWSGLYQQEPTPGAGALFQIDKLIEISESEVPQGLRECRGWDLAATEQQGSNNPDWTVGVKMAATKQANGKIYILDVDRFRTTPNEVKRAVKRNARKDGPACTIEIPKDPGQAGVAQALDFTNDLAGFKVTFRRPTGSKQARATPFATAVEAGLVHVVRGAWNQDYYAELRDFWSGQKDDQVDASSSAFEGLMGVPAAPARRLQLDFMRR